MKPVTTEAQGDGDHADHVAADEAFAGREEPEELPCRGKRRPRTIRFRLACLVLACVLPVCVIAGFLVFNSYDRKQHALESSVLETARALSLVVDRELANMQASMTALATSPSLDAGDLAAFHRQAQLVLREYPDGDIILADATGQQLVNSYVPFGKPLPKRNAPTAVGGVYATGKPVISNLFKGAVTGRPLISIDVPVFRGGRVVYDLALTIPAERLGMIFSQQRISPEWTASIFDGNFVIAARNRFPEKYVGMQGNPVVMRRRAETAEGSVNIANKEGTDVLAVFSRSMSTGWTVVVGIPKTVFVAEIWHSLRWATCVIIFLSITGIGLALFLAQQIAESIQALIVPALALGSGKAVDIGQLDLEETNQVGQSLMRASQLLQQRTAERERAEAIRRQAAELERSNAELQRRESDARVHAAELSVIMKALRESEERLSLVVHSANLGTWDWDIAADKLVWSSRCLELFGLAPDAPMGYRQFLDAVHPEDRVRVDEAVRTALKKHEEYDTEMRTIWPDGSLHWVSLRGRAYYDSSGRAVRMSGAALDITDHKMAEEALIRSEKLASAGRMAATVAHEINNPLEAINNAVYLAWTDKSISKDTKAYLDIAVQELNRVAHLAQRTLSFYRERTTPSLVDLRSTVDGVLDLFTPRLKTRGIIVERRYAEVDKISAVDGEIRQIVSNLISNSFDAIPKTGKILFRIKSFGANNSRSIWFTIADTGVGIPPEHITKIFQPFYTTKEVVGTGLGLWVTKELVQKHGGHIRVRSKEGKGTVFAIVFPIARQSAASEQQISLAAFGGAM